MTTSFRELLTPSHGDPTPSGFQSRPESEPSAPWFLIGERERRLYPIDPHKIDYIESDGNYLALRVGAVEYVTRDTLKRLEPLLAPLGFIRIERSLLLNLRAIAYVEPSGRGSFAFTLSCGACIRSSHTFRAAILRTLPLVQACARGPRSARVGV